SAPSASATSRLRSATRMRVRSLSMTGRLGSSIRDRASRWGCSRPCRLVWRAPSGLNEPGPARRRDRLQARMGSQLFEQAPDVAADGAVTDTEVIGDLGVAEALGQQPEDVFFARRQ